MTYYLDDKQAYGPSDGPAKNVRIHNPVQEKAEINVLPTEESAVNHKSSVTSVTPDLVIDEENPNTFSDPNNTYNIRSIADTRKAVVHESQNDIKTNKKEHKTAKIKNVYIDQEYWKAKLTHVLHNTQFCGICLSTDEDMNMVSDDFEIVCERTHKKTLEDIVDVLFNETETLLASTKICKSCTQKLIQSYMFIQNARETAKILNYHLNELYNKSCFTLNNILKDVADNSEVQNVVIALDNLYNEECVTEEIEEIDEESIVSNNGSHHYINLPTPRNESHHNINLPTQRNESHHNINLPTQNNESHRNINLPTQRNESHHNINLPTQRNESHHNINLPTQNNESHHNINLPTQKVCQINKTQSLITSQINQHGGQVRQYLRAPKSKRMVILCPTCDIPFYSPGALSVHQQEKHSSDNFKCPICTKSFTDRVKLVLHKCKYTCDCSSMPCVHHKYLMYFRVQKLKHLKAKCLNCNYMCKSKQALITHINRKHLKYRPYTCDVCRQTFYSKKVMRSHILNAHTDKNLCMFCGMEFVEMSRCGRHERMCLKKN